MPFCLGKIVTTIMEAWSAGRTWSEGRVRDGGGGLGEALSYVYDKSVADQRCIFHKLKNVNGACSPSLAAESSWVKPKESIKLKVPRLPVSCWQNGSATGAR